MAIKMILCDLDGTLYTSDKTISERTIETIKKVREQGVIFGIASGRSCSFIRHHFTKMGLNDLIDVIVGDGGYGIDDALISVDTQNYPLHYDVMRRIMDHFASWNVTFGIPIGQELVFSEDSDIIRHVTSINKYPYSVRDFNELIKEEATKFCVFCWEKDLDAVEEHATHLDVGDLNAYFVRSGPYLIEYADTHVTKDQGIARLLEAHHLSLDELMVFGDADNDYGMINYAKYGIVMANGTE
ncbi:MAG: HAD family phosphatase, partial [Erysipelotrichaceae bacterium]|nr:HAD family phosphatase [Erysipelotrichaceae bacterium]